MLNLHLQESLRPPKRPSKAKNGQKSRFFWSRPKIVGQRGKNWPSRISPMIGELITLKDPPSEVSRFGARRPSPVKKITSWPISKFKGIYMQKKSFWPKQKGSNSSQIIQWSSVGHITIHFRGLRGLRRAPKPKFWLFDQKKVFTEMLISPEPDVPQGWLRCQNDRESNGYMQDPSDEVYFPLFAWADLL